MPALHRSFWGRAYLAFRYPVLFFVAIMLVGTAGYWQVSGGKATVLDCAYMTFITIATIGYAEVIDLSNSPGGRVFTMAIGAVGVANIFYMTSKMTAFIVESEFNAEQRRRRMQRTIDALQAHYIRYVGPESYSVVQSLNLVVMNVIGGMASLPGVMLGTVFMVMLPELLRGYVNLQHILFGAILFATMAFNPGGLIEIVRRLRALPRAVTPKEAA